MNSQEFEAPRRGVWMSPNCESMAVEREDGEFEELERSDGFWAATGMIEVVPDDWTPLIPEDLTTMASLLREAGYQVIRTPGCTKPGGHGKHTLAVKTVMCPGVEPIPHGVQNVYNSTFGLKVTCACGTDFLDTGEEPTEWKQHEAEYIPQS